MGGEAEALGFEGDGATAGEGVMDGGEFAAAAAADFGAGLL